MLSEEQAEVVSRPKKKRISKKKRIFIMATLALAVIGAGWFMLSALSSAGGPVNRAGIENNGAVLAKPEDGDPSMYSAKENIFITIGVTENMKSYKTHTTGQALAKVGFIDYTQVIKNEKIVTEDSVFLESVSTSALKKVAEQKYFQDNAVLMKKATKWNGDEPVFGDDMLSISTKDYEDAYGQSPRKFSNYVINEDTVKNEAMEQDGENTVLTFELDPKTAPVYYLRQVRTLGGASQDPVFSSVKMKLTIDKEWRPVSLETIEVYDISLPAIGATTCEGNLLEVFSDFEAAQNENSEFSDYMENEYDPNKLDSLEGEDMSEMISAMFEKNPNYKLTLNGDDINVNCRLNVNMKNKTFMLRGSAAGINNIFAAYRNNRVYIHAGSQKISMTASSMLEAAKAVAGFMGSSLPEINISDSLISRIMSEMEMTETDTGMNVVLKDKMVSGTVVLNNEDELSLAGVSLRLNLAGKRFNVKASPCGSFKTEKLSGYHDLSGAVQNVLKPLLKAVKAPGMNISGYISYDTLKLPCEIDLMNTTNGAELLLTSNIEGESLKVMYVNETVYVSLGNVKLKGGVNDIKELISCAMSLAGKSSSLVPEAYSEFFKNVTPNKVISSVTALNYKNGVINAGFNISGKPVIISASKNSLSLNSGKLAAKLNINGLYDKTQAIMPCGSFVDVKDISSLIASYAGIKDSSAIKLSGSLGLNGNSYDFAAVVNTSDNPEIELKTTIEETELTAAYKNNKLYLSAGNVKVCAEISDIKEAAEKLKGSVPVSGEEITSLAETIKEISSYFSNLSAGKLISSVNHVSYSNGVLQAGLKINDIKLTADLSASNASLRIRSPKEEINAQISIAELLGERAQIASGEDYVNISELRNSFAYIDGLLSGKSADFDILLNLADADLRINAQVNYKEELSLLASFVYEGVPIRATLINDSVYIDAQNIHVSCALADLQDAIERITSALGKELPSPISESYAEFFGDLSVKSILGAIEKLTFENGELKASVKIGEDDITLLADKNGISLSGVTLFNKAACARINVKQIYKELRDFTPENSYCDLKEAASTVENLSSYLSADSFNLAADLSLGGNAVSLSGTASLKDSPALSFNTELFGKAANVTLYDGRAYVSIGEIRASLSLDELDSLISHITALTGEDAFGEILPQSYKEYFNSLSFSSVINSVGSLGIDNGIIAATVKIGEDNVSVIINETGLKLYGITLNSKSAEAAVTLKEKLSGSGISKPEGEFTDASDLYGIIDSLAEVKNSKVSKFNVNVRFGEKEYSGTGVLSLEDGISARISLAVKKNTLNITLYDGVIYFDLANIHISATPEELKSVISGFTDIKADSSFDIDPESLIDAVSALTFDKASGTLKAEIKLSDSKASVSLSEKTLSASMDGYSAAFTLTETSNATENLAPTGEYTKASELLDAIDAIKESINSSAFAVNADISTIKNGKSGAFTGDIKLVKNGENFDVSMLAKLVSGSDEHNIDLTYKNGDFYAVYNGLKLKMSNKELIPILASFKKVLQIDVPVINSLLECDESLLIDLSVFDSYVPEGGYLKNLSDIDILAALKSLSYKDGILNVGLFGSEIGNGISDVDLTLSIEDGKVSDIKVQNLALEGVNINGSLKISYPKNAEITAPNPSGYIVLDSLNTLLRDFSSTANLRQYHMTGKLKASILFYSPEINFDIKIKLNDKDRPTVIIKLDIPRVIGVTNNKTTSYVYIDNDIVYMYRELAKTTFFGKDRKDYRKCTLEQFGKDYMKYIYHITNLTSTIQNSINSSIKDSGDRGALKVEKVLKNYVYSGGRYTLTADGAYLVNDKNFKDITVSLTSGGKYLNTVSLNTGYSIIGLKLDGTLTDIGQNVDLSALPQNLAYDSCYSWY